MLTCLSFPFMCYIACLYMQRNSVFAEEVTFGKDRVTRDTHCANVLAPRTSSLRERPRLLSYFPSILSMFPIHVSLEPDLSYHVKMAIFGFGRSLYGNP